MLESTAVSAGDLLLRDADFPDHFVNMQHPDDYRPTKSIVQENILHPSGRHTRLITRISWRTDKGDYVPMSFVCDTGAPMGFYLSDRARRTLKHIGRLLEDDATGSEYVVINQLGRAIVEDTPPGHAPANIMGLRVLLKTGLKIEPATTSFVLTYAPNEW